MSSGCGNLMILFTSEVNINYLRILQGKYAIIDYEVDPARMPPYLPNLEFRTTIYAYFKESNNNITLFDAKVEGAVDNAIAWKRFKIQTRKH